MTDGFEPPSTFGSGPSTAGLPRIGTVFAGYGLEGVLGRGGMSVVYRADNVRLGNKIALKVLNPDLSEDDAFRERFVRESRVAASISHPHIIPIYDAGDSEGLLYIVMRYIEGADMKELLRRQGPLPVARACALVSQVGGALHAAHERGLIHRDIKPGNILIERIDDGIQVLEHVYLADFGLTKHAQSRSGLTHTGQFVGTVDYVAPEQIEGRTVDRRADVYSLGCVLYECLAGVVPYHRENDVAVLWAHVQEPCPALGTLRSDLPEGMEAVVGRAMAKSPDDRYQTAAEFVADVSRFGREAGSRMTISGVSAPISSASVTPIETIGGAAGGSGPPSAPRDVVRAGRDDGEHVTSMPSRSKRSVQGVAAVLVAVAVVAIIGLYALSRSSHTAAPPNPGSGSNTNTGGTTGPAVTGTPNQQYILNRIPAVIRKTCTPQPAENHPGNLATVNCTPTMGGVKGFLHVDHFPNTRYLDLTYALHGPDAIKALGGSPGHGRCNTIDWLGEGPWSHGGPATAGRRACYMITTHSDLPPGLKPPQSVIVWTFTQEHLFMIAFRPGTIHGDLFYWWNFWHHQFG
jgi:serine/threonine protein kinase